MISAIWPAIRPANKSAVGNNKLGKKVRFANVLQSQPHSDRKSGSSWPLQQTPANSISSSSLAFTGVRILQLNMRRSTVVMGEVRQLVVEKHLDVLLLQEPHVRKQGSSHTLIGLGTGMRVAAVRSQHS